MFFKNLDIKLSAFAAGILGGMFLPTDILPIIVLLSAVLALMLMLRRQLQAPKETGSDSTQR